MRRRTAYRSTTATRRGVGRERDMSSTSIDHGSAREAARVVVIRTVAQRTQPSAGTPAFRASSERRTQSPDAATSPR
jgi:hypothetical protein